MFDWVFEVEEDTGEERGRLSFSLEYERGNQGTVSNKVQAFIDIQHDNIYAIVPVIKVLSLSLTINYYCCFLRFADEIIICTRRMICSTYAKVSRVHLNKVRYKYCAVMDKGNAMF